VALGSRAQFGIRCISLEEGERRSSLVDQERLLGLGIEVVTAAGQKGSLGSGLKLGGFVFLIGVRTLLKSGLKLGGFVF
jgi:hypothetical protein